ncbi:MAG: AAA family ATPase [Planctomycetota bacterium]
MARRLFIAGSAQNAGKTTMSVGLLFALHARFASAGFIKPIGQRWIEAEGVRVDEDAVLMKTVFRFPDNLKDMNPITVESRVTRDFIDAPERELFIGEIARSFASLERDRDVMVIEGTGHAGVGSVFDLSNAQVAKLLDAPAILVARAGIGRSIDEIWLNQCVFEREGVRLAGVIVNRCRMDKLDEVSTYVGKGLRKKGIELLGVIPDTGLLRARSVLQILQAIDGELLNGADQTSNTILRIVVGAMSPHRALDYFDRHSLLITPGEREDLILAAMSSCLMRTGKERCVSAIMLTGGLRPHRRIMSLIRKTKIPVMLVPYDSYTAASRVHDHVAKIHPEDKKKISLARRLVRRHVNIERLLELV